MKISLRRAGAVTVAAGALLLASACSSATDSDSGSDTDAAAADNPCVTKAEAVVDTARGDAALSAPTEPLDGAAMAGKNIWVISILTNQWTQGVSVGLNDAADNLGIDLTIYDGQGSVDRWNTGMAQAIASKADGIVLLAVDPKLVSQAVADAAAAGIPVTNAYSAKQGDAVLPGIFSNFQADNKTDGYNTAAWMIADSGCKAHALMMYGSGVAVWEAQAEGAEEAFKELCPDDCELTTKAIDLANMATDMPRQTQTELTRDPDIKYVYPAQDSAVPFVEPAVSQIGTDIKIVSRDGLAENMDALREGGLQKLDVAMPPDRWTGFAILDEMSRAVLGMPSGEMLVPTRLIDETNIGSSNDEIFPAYSDYESVFLDMWGTA
jgi:ABC-type sugar transport system substrate-binding protein